MSASSTTVNFNLKDAGYANFANQTITFTLKNVGADVSATDSPVIGRGSVSGISDASGNGSLTVFNTGSSDTSTTYDITLPGSEHVQVIIPSSAVGGSIELSTLLRDNQVASTPVTDSLLATAVNRANHTGDFTLDSLPNGSITGTLAIANGGTNSSSASSAASALGVGVGDSPLFSGLDVNGGEIILDADGDTSITADTDDKIDIKVAGTDQIQFTDGAIVPVTDNDIDLGSAAKGFKNIYADGTSLVGSVSASSVNASSGGFSIVTATTADIDGGTIDGVAIGSSSAATIVKADNLQLDGNAITSTDTNGNIDITPNGTGEVNISKVDINDGVIDSTVIGGTTPAAVTGTNVLASTSIGYTTGNGGTVTQLTDINTAVTLNKTSGTITLVAHDFVQNQVDSFTLNNTTILATDVIILSLQDGSERLSATVTDVASGSCQITLKNGTNSATGSITVKINFAVIKAVNS